MKFDGDDIHSAALCATKEARGEVKRFGFDSCAAVLWIIANRARDWKRSSVDPVHDVIYGKNQFTSMSVPSDPEFNWVPALPDDVAIMNQCLVAASDILAGNGTDPTVGAHYYWNPKTAGKDGWFARNIAANPNDHPIKAEIGDHIFYA